MTVAYVWAKPDKYMQLLKTRNRVHGLVDTDHYYRKQRPHITLIPSFKIQSNSRQQIVEKVAASGIEGTEIHVNGLEAHESTSNPYAVYLSVDIEGSEKIEQLTEDLQPYSKVPITSGVDTHISLFKTRGCWDEVPEEVSKRLSNEIEFQNTFDNLTIENVKVEFKR